MLMFIARMLMFALAIALACDALLPTHAVVERVDRHLARTARQNLTAYSLEFAGGEVASCGVGWTAFDALKDGDEVTISTTRVFKSCQAIARDGVPVSRPGIGKWVTLAIAAFLLAGAFGWLDLRSRTTDGDIDGDDRGWWWFWS